MIKQWHCNMAVLNKALQDCVLEALKFSHVYFVINTVAVQAHDMLIHNNYPGEHGVYIL